MAAQGHWLEGCHKLNLKISQLQTHLTDGWNNWKSRSLKEQKLRKQMRQSCTKLQQSFLNKEQPTLPK